MTIISYLITIIISRLGLFAIISMPISFIVGKLTKIHVISAAFGFFVTYFLLDLLWVLIEGNNIPIVLLILILILNYIMEVAGLLTEAGKRHNMGEQIAIICFIFKLLVFSESIRWV